MIISSPFIWFPLLFALGACLGSFVNVVSLRLPALLAGQSTNGDRADVPGLMRPGSRCTSCLTPLRFYQNIPIASFIFLSGKCGFCAARISPRYPVVEVIAALSAVMLGVIYDPGWQLAAGLIFVCVLLTLSLIDMDHQVLPDLIVLPFLWVGLMFNSFSVFADLHSAVFGAVTGYIVPWATNRGFHGYTNRQGMGYGDFKLFAAICAWLGVQMWLVVVALACLFSFLFLVYRKFARGQAMREPLFFGPFVALAAFASILLWPWLYIPRPSFIDILLY